MEEEQDSGGASQDTDFAFLSSFGLLELLIQRIYSLLLLIFYYFVITVWPWILFGRGYSWSWILSTSSIQCHSNPVFVIPHKPPNNMKDI